MDAQYVAVARVVSLPAEPDQVELLIVPTDDAGTNDWPVLAAAAVGRWSSNLCPNDVPTTLLTRAEVGVDELGWRIAPGPNDATSFPVERKPEAFRATLIEPPPGPMVQVVTGTEGRIVAEYESCAGSAAETLWRHGWASKRLDGWPAGWLTVWPLDWMSLIETETVSRRHAQAIASTAEQRWRTLLQEAVLAGVEVSRLSAITHLTRQRIYQIRDGRR